jgi:alkyldihydroxyacetonephosphate synthase
MRLIAAQSRAKLRAMQPTPPSLLEALRADLGARHVRVAGVDRVAYARDLWPRTQLDRLVGEAPTLPDAIVWPGTTAEVARVVRLCAEAGVPIVPFGAGSGVCGGTLPSLGGIVVDLKRLKALRRFAPEDGIIEVEAGYMGERLERVLEHRGYTLGHFPSSILCSTVGGWVAARSAGQCSSRYGKIEDMVVDLEVVTGDGVVRRTPRHDHLGPGLDWNQIFTGSEGTLGLITSATLKIHPQPEARAFRGWRVPNFEAGLTVMREAMQAGLRPAVLRLYDPLDTLMVGSDGDKQRSGPLQQVKKQLLGGGRFLKTVLKHPTWMNRAAGLAPQRCLLVTMTEGSPYEARSADEALAEFARAAGGEDLGEGPGRAWLAHRYDVSFKQSKVYASGAFVDTFEVAATWDRVPEVYRAVCAAVRDHVVVMAHFSHAYPGGCSIYFTFSGAAESPEACRDRYTAAWQAGLDAALASGAAIAHHHGVGLSRRTHMHAAHGEARQWFEALKATLDPAGVLNPGKVFATPEAPDAP